MPTHADRQPTRETGQAPNPERRPPQPTAAHPAPTAARAPAPGRGDHPSPGPQPGGPPPPEAQEGARGAPPPECPHESVTEPSETALDGSEDRKRSPARRGTNRVTERRGGYIPTSLVLWTPQRDVLVDALEMALHAYTDGQLKLFCHVASRQYTDPKACADGVPIWHEVIEGLDEHTHRHSARAVYEYLHAAGLLHYTRYVVPSGETPGQSRRFAVSRSLLDRLADVSPLDPSDLPGRVDVFSGNRSRQQARRHVLHENGNAVGSPLYQSAMQHLKYDVFDAPRVIAHLEHLRNERDRLHALWCRAGGHEYVQSLRETMKAAEASLDTDASALSTKADLEIVRAYEDDHGEPRTDEYLRYRKARGRYLNDRSCYDQVLHQLPDPTDTPGVWRYRLAYQHQVSGRAGAIGGMMQSCTRPMKEAGHGALPNVYNYDLVASQPNFLIEEFEEANVHSQAPSPPLDASWLHSYLGVTNSKIIYAKRVGIPVKTWKNALLAMMMGAYVATDVHRSKGEIAKAFRTEFAGSTTAQLGASWVRFRTEVEPFYPELKRWHTWLDKEVAHDHSTSGPHRRGGRWVRNKAGETYHWRRQTPVFEREAQLAAHMLQGREAAFILHLITLSQAYGFGVLGNEHDGVVSQGEIPADAIEQAKARAGVQRADLRIKAYT